MHTAKTSRIYSKTKIDGRQKKIKSPYISNWLIIAKAKYYTVIKQDGNWEYERKLEKNEP